MPYYSKNFRKTSLAAFANAAMREEFRGRDLSLARDPNFVDRPPNKPPALAAELLSRLELLGIGAAE